MKKATAGRINHVKVNFKKVRRLLHSTHRRTTENNVVPITRNICVRTKDAQWDLSGNAFLNASIFR